MADATPLTEAAAQTRISHLADVSRRQVALFGAIFSTASLLLPVGLVLYAQINGKDYADFFWGEDNAITWFSSVQLLMVGTAAFANFQADALLRRLGGTRVARHRWIWLAFALGFVFLGIDERFEYHEWLRDDVFRPGGLFNVPYLRSGDVTMYAYLGVGLVFAAFLLDELRSRFSSLVLFGSAVLLAGSTVVIDTLDKKITKAWPFYEFWTSAFEESGEIWAQSLFLLSFLVLLHWRLGELKELRPQPRPAE